MARATNIWRLEPVHLGRATPCGIGVLQEQRIIRQLELIRSPVFLLPEDHPLDDVIWSTLCGPILVSDRVIRALERLDISGWKAIPARVFREQRLIELSGYSLLSLKSGRGPSRPSSFGLPARTSGVEEKPTDIWLDDEKFSNPLMTKSAFETLTRTQVSGLRGSALTSVTQNGGPESSRPILSWHTPTPDSLISILADGNGRIARAVQLARSEVDIEPQMYSYLRGLIADAVAQSLIEGDPDGDAARVIDVIDQYALAEHPANDSLLASDFAVAVLSLLTGIAAAEVRVPAAIRRLARESAPEPSSEIMLTSPSQGNVRIPSTPHVLISTQRDQIPLHIRAAWLLSLNAASARTRVFAEHSSGYLDGVMRGDIIPNEPVKFFWHSGRALGPVIPGMPVVPTSVSVPLFHSDVIAVANERGLTGFATFPVRVFGPDNCEIAGYSGITVAGRYISKAKVKPSGIPRMHMTTHDFWLPMNGKTPLLLSPRAREVLGTFESNPADWELIQSG